MRKKISFVILGSSGAPAKQVSASKSSIYILVAVLISFIAGVGYVVYDYNNLRGTTSHLQNREIYLSGQLEEIQIQRKQIQEFANEINSLKANLKIKSESLPMLKERVIPTVFSVWAAQYPRIWTPESPSRKSITA